MLLFRASRARLLTVVGLLAIFYLFIVNLRCNVALIAAHSVEQSVHSITFSYWVNLILGYILIVVQ